MRKNDRTDLEVKENENKSKNVLRDQKMSGYKNGNAEKDQVEKPEDERRSKTTFTLYGIVDGKTKRTGKIAPKLKLGDEIAPDQPIRVLRTVRCFVRKVRKEWTKGYLAYFDDLPTMQGYISRKMMQRGIVILPAQEFVALEMKDRPFPGIFKAPRTKIPPYAIQTPPHLCKFESSIASCEESFIEEATRRLKKAISAANCDDKQIIVEAPAHRRRCEEENEVRSVWGARNAAK